jgi:hypothetical protein
MLSRRLRVTSSPFIAPEGGGVLAGAVLRRVQRPPAMWRFAAAAPLLDLCWLPEQRWPDLAQFDGAERVSGADDTGDGSGPRCRCTADAAAEQPAAAA